VQFWALAYNPPAAVIVVWATGIEEARRLALEHLADQAPGVDPTETAVRQLEEAVTGYVVLSSLVDVSR
jgi:hypothetical protein